MKTQEIANDAFQKLGHVQNKLMRVACKPESIHVLAKEIDNLLLEVLKDTARMKASIGLEELYGTASNIRIDVFVQDKDVSVETFLRHCVDLDILVDTGAEYLRIRSRGHGLFEWSTGRDKVLLLTPKGQHNFTKVFGK